MANQTLLAVRLATALLGSALLAAGCGGDGGESCGNSRCEAGENPDSCAADCGCGNGLVNLSEQCDGTVGNATCASQGQGAGTLACNADCTFDYSGCTAATCGNGAIDPAEDCDGSMLGGGTCTGAGFSAGELRCSEVCTYDYAACCNDLCPGDGATQCGLDFIQTCRLQADGCLVWENDLDCTDLLGYCSDEGGTPTCTCDDECQPGTQRCNQTHIQDCQLLASNCYGWVDSSNCADVAGQTCAVGPSGPQCVAAASGEDCSDPFPLTEGYNLVFWNATEADYLPSAYPCGTVLSNPDGADVVLAYTASSAGAIEYVVDKPPFTEWVVSVSSGTCGNVNPQLSCTIDYSPAQMFGEFSSTAGTTYYFYVSDEVTGTPVLTNPFGITITEIDCSTFNAVASNFAPANGATTGTLEPALSVDFDSRVRTTSGTVTITGNMGTSITYDLATSPSQVMFSNNDRTMTISTGAPFPPGETITVTWNLVDDKCGRPVTAPTWSFDVIVPPCAPGTGGVVGTTASYLFTPLTSVGEYYIEPDDDPNGYIYFGGTSELYRVPKAGGTIEDIALLGSLTFSHLGYDMLINGSDIFTLESTTLITGRVFRISEDGGTSWMRQDFVTFPTNPQDDFRGMAYRDGRIYLVTHEQNAASETEIWSFEATPAAVPAVAQLELGFSGELYCSGLDLDDTYYYTACGGGQRLVRVHRTTGQVDVLSDFFPYNTLKNAVRAHDIDGDGTADAIYSQSSAEVIYYTCDPAGTPYTDVLLDLGGVSGTYGIGFEPTASAIWAFDDDTFELIKLQ